MYAAKLVAGELSVDPMQHLIPVLLLLLAASTLVAGDRESARGNLVRLDSCARRVADTLLPAISDGDTLLLPPLLGEVAPMVTAHLLAATSRHGLAVSLDRCPDSDPGIVTAQVRYRALDDRSFLLREARLTLEIAPRSRCALPLSEYRILTAVLLDTVATADTALLADSRVAASHGQFEEENGWLAPVLVIGSVLLSALLLFTVRSQ